MRTLNKIFIQLNLYVHVGTLLLLLSTAVPAQACDLNLIAPNDGPIFTKNFYQYPNGSDTILMIKDRLDPRFYGQGILQIRKNELPTLRMEIVVWDYKTGDRSQVLVAHQVFHDLFLYFEGKFEQFEAVWPIKSPHLMSNLKVFQELEPIYGENRAAEMTWTGKQLSLHGFKVHQVDVWPDVAVFAKFKKDN